MATLTIVSFYEKIGEIVSDYQEHILTESNAILKIDRLIAQAKRDGLKVDMSPHIIHAINQFAEPTKNSRDYDDDSSMIC